MTLLNHGSMRTERALIALGSEEPKCIKIMREWRAPRSLSHPPKLSKNKSTVIIWRAQTYWQERRAACREFYSVDVIERFSLCSRLRVRVEVLFDSIIDRILVQYKKPRDYSYRGSSDTTVRDRTYSKWSAKFNAVFDPPKEEGGKENG